MKRLTEANLFVASDLINKKRKIQKQIKIKIATKLPQTINSKDCI